MRHPLIDRLVSAHQADDRALLAALRRGASSSALGSVYPIVAPFFPKEPNGGEEQALFDVAVLFALHPGDGSLNLGQALRRIGENTRSDNIEPRFVALLDSHPEDLVPHLRHAVSLARAHDIALDWDDILRALRYWGHPSLFVQRRWARDFWTTGREEEVS